MTNYKSVAIDGPSGAGKSTLARQAAKALGFLYVDTGAIYRTVGLYALEHGADPADAQQVVPLLSQVEVTMGYGEDGLQRMYSNGEDVTDAIRQHRVSDATSKVSSIPAVRNYLLEMQRKLAECHNVVMDGRDIGTVVLPNAQVKIFLTASAEARATRRCAELNDRGTPADFDQILADIEDRDYRDTHRETAPLVEAPDSVRLDTTTLTLAESGDALINHIKGALGL